MNGIDKIKIEKINFLENHSQKFYNELFNKDEENNSTICLITNMLLREEKLEDCKEYSFLNGMIETEQQEEIKNSFLPNILTTITQFLTRLGAEDSAKVILSYFKYEAKKEFEAEKSLYLA